MDVIIEVLNEFILAEEKKLFKSLNGDINQGILENLERIDTMDEIIKSKSML